MPSRTAGRPGRAPAAGRAAPPARPRCAGGPGCAAPPAPAATTRRGGRDRPGSVPAPVPALRCGAGSGAFRERRTGTRRGLPALPPAPAGCRPDNRRQPRARPAGRERKRKGRRCGRGGDSWVRDSGWARRGPRRRSRPATGLRRRSSSANNTAWVSWQKACSQLPGWLQAAGSSPSPARPAQCSRWRWAKRLASRIGMLASKLRSRGCSDFSKAASSAASCRWPGLPSASALRGLGAQGADAGSLVALLCQVVAVVRRKVGGALGADAGQRGRKAQAGAFGGEHAVVGNRLARVRRMRASCACNSGAAGCAAAPAVAAGWLFSTAERARASVKSSHCPSRSPKSYLKSMGLLTVSERMRTRSARLKVARFNPLVIYLCWAGVSVAPVSRLGKGGKATTTLLHGQCRRRAAFAELHLPFSQWGRRLRPWAHPASRRTSGTIR